VLPYDWAEFFRWPSRGDSWSVVAYLLFPAKLALAAMTWLVLIAVILTGVSLLPAAVAGIAYFLGLSAQVAAIPVMVASLVSIYLLGDLLDL
jgi:hypothetical protein